MDLWVGRRRGVCVGAFRIFGDKIPAFTWMDGGSPSEGGFYAVEFPTPKDIRRSLLWGCGSASFTVLPNFGSNITDAFQKYFIQQFSGSWDREKNCILSGNAEIRERALSKWFIPFLPGKGPIGPLQTAIFVMQKYAVFLIYTWQQWPFN